MHAALEAIQRICGSFSSPATGIAFTVPLDRVVGLAPTLVAEDSRERLWIGTRAGLLRLDRSRVNAEVIALDLPGPEEPTITELLVDAADNVWLGTLNQGLVRLDGQTGERTVYKDYNDVEIGGLASQPVRLVRARRSVGCRLDHPGVRPSSHGNC